MKTSLQLEGELRGMSARDELLKKLDECKVNILVNSAEIVPEGEKSVGIAQSTITIKILKEYDHKIKLRKKYLFDCLLEKHKLNFTIETLSDLVKTFGSEF